MDEIRLTQLIAPAFDAVHEDVKAACHTHYWLKGGRGSTKSSFISLELLLCLMRDAREGIFTHAIVLRRYSVTLRESVFAQLLWAVGALGVQTLWEPSLSPLKLTYLPSGQSILFRGLDDAAKLKSVKAERGYIKYAWFEEVNELEGMEKIRSVLQSVNRGGERFINFYSFNPPKSQGDWVNREVVEAGLRSDTLVHHSDYRSVPREWLGEQFLAEASHLAQVRPEAYRHEYLGEAVGTGGEVFKNVTLRELTPQEVARFDNLRRGIDWGYAADPFAYNVCHFDAARRRLFLFFEVHALRISNRAAAQRIKKEAGAARIICDSAEPKSIDEMKGYGLRVAGAKKGPDSVSYGIKWLSDLEEIVIDPVRCPESAREFCGYAIGRDREGRLLSQYPDRDNHHIDAVRYACEGDMTRRGVKF
ncbi:PBSX family phage terminase large subunit [Oscillospiraceae bacterium LTW-04]|nr:phage terminase large subunit [Oscillospiraceae bacterium MB24-C1]